MKLKGLGKRLYNIFFHTHTVAGITISAGLFVIFYAGSFALFRGEIYRWENPEARGMARVELDVSKSIAAIREAEPALDESKALTIRSGHDDMPFGKV
ncbi:MAG: PepSY-associated TM helix domain-containing protein, partial [Bacteroidota bacterium]